MIREITKREINPFSCKHVAFPVCIEGNNTDIFSKKLIEAGWSKLVDLGDYSYGDVISMYIGSTMFHAMVCYTKNPFVTKVNYSQAEILQNAIDNIPMEDDAVLHISSLPNTSIDLLSGNNSHEIIFGLHSSNRNIVFHTLVDEYQILEILNGHDYTKRC